MRVVCIQAYDIRIVVKCRFLVFELQFKPKKENKLETKWDSIFRFFFVGINCGVFIF